MASLNKVMLIGNVTRDPELKHTPRGTATCEVGLAINRTYTQGDEKKEETIFVDVTLWGRQAEVAAEYAKKGRALFIEGRLQIDSWDDKETGKKRTKLKVVGENIQLLGGRGESGGESRAPSEQSAPAPRRLMPKAESKPLDDQDEIPF